MKRWRLTPRARRELTEIWFYTAEHWGIDQADAYVRQIEEDLTWAAASSPLVQPLDDKWRVRSGRRLCIFSKQEDGTIEVIRILHEWQDVRGALS